MEFRLNKFFVILINNNNNRSDIVQKYKRDKNINNEFFDSYDNGNKSGFLHVFRPSFLKKMFKSEWKEMFVVLSDIGLLCFKVNIILIT